MPANEETLSMTSDQIKDNLFGKVYDDSIQNNFDCESSSDDEEDYQNDCSRSIVKENFKEICNYKSLPIREIHKKFMKSFVNLLLEEAVFEVSSSLKLIITEIWLLQKNNLLLE